MANIKTKYVTALDIILDPDFLRGFQDVRANRPPPPLEDSYLYEDGRIFATEWPKVTEAHITLGNRRNIAKKYISKEVEGKYIRSVKSGSIL